MRAVEDQAVSMCSALGKILNCIPASATGQAADPFCSSAILICVFKEISLDKSVCEFTEAVKSNTHLEFGVELVIVKFDVQGSYQGSLRWLALWISKTRSGSVVVVNLTFSRIKS